MATELSKTTNAAPVSLPANNASQTALSQNSKGVSGQSVLVLDEHIG